MNCVLTKENQRQIEALIRSGRFNNRSEVLRAGLRSLLREEQGFPQPKPMTQKEFEEVYAPTDLARDAHCLPGCLAGGADLRARFREAKTQFLS